MLGCLPIAFIYEKVPPQAWQDNGSDFPPWFNRAFIKRMESMWGRSDAG